MNYQWRGHTHRRLKNYLAALADYTKAIELQPENGYNYLGRGRTHLRMENYAAALADLDKAVELVKNAYTYAWRGRVYLQTNDIAEAKADFDHVEAMLNNEGRPAYIVAAGYSQLNQVAEKRVPGYIGPVNEIKP
jgi:tetratricopeptide (TPR) repeat protein